MTISFRLWENCLKIVACNSLRYSHEIFIRNGCSLYPFSTTSRNAQDSTKFWCKH